MEDGAGPCCSPSADRDRPSPADAAPATGSGAETPDLDLVTFDEVTFVMGTDQPGYPGDGEGPARSVTLSPHAVATTTVTNQVFAHFVTATGYHTEAEHYGWSFVFGGLLPDDLAPTRGMVGAEWWRQVEGADWAHPEGPHTSLTGREHHPVVHVSWNDAQAFCVWSHTRLPTEAEWEHAARGGTESVFPWGDELEPGGTHRMNVWQGQFPSENTVADGWYGTAPADAYPANGFGLYNVCGNVWEWCGDHYTNEHRAEPVRDPVGPGEGRYRVVRGGSYLCHASYCNRYRLSARSHNTADSSSGNTGFRVARSTAA